MLRAQGFDVAVFERAGEALANRGAGIATHKELYEAVRSAGIEFEEIRFGNGVEQFQALVGGSLDVLSAGAALAKPFMIGRSRKPALRLRQRPRQETAMRAIQCR